MKITIIGAKGFIGSALTTFMNDEGYRVEEVYRGHSIIQNYDYGTIIYCAGIKSNFSLKTHDLIQSNILDLMQWLTKAKYNQFIYISSARIYMNLDHGSEQSNLFKIKSDDIYNQSKILAETICRNLNKNCLILRPSNVLGFDPNSSNFIWQLLRELQRAASLKIAESLENSRDYVNIDFLCHSIVNLIQKNASGIYNISSGINLTNLEVCNILKSVANIKNISFGQKKVTMPCISNLKIIEKTEILPACPIKSIKSIALKFLAESKTIL